MSLIGAATGAIGGAINGLTGGGGSAGGAAGGGGSDAKFEAALARMEAAGDKRIEQDARRTEVQEQIGASKQAAARTSV